MTYATYEQSLADGQPVELYRFAQGISRWLYTSSQAPVDYLSETYQPLTLARGAIEQANEIHRNGIEITLPRDCPVAALFIAAPPEGIVSVTIYRKHIPDTEFITYWKGRVTAARFSGSVVQLKCEPIATSLKRVGLRARYQLLCRHVLYSASCGALRESYRVDGTVASVSGTQLSVAAAAGQANGYFVAGMLSSAAGLRMITAHTGSSLTLAAPLIGLKVGDAVSLFAGCDHTTTQCAGRFNNLDNFGGFPFIPVKNPSPGTPSSEHAKTMWQQILIWVITTVLSALLAPRPKAPENAQPGQIGDKDVPIASMDAPIPVLFGTRVLSGPNVVWYGDVQVRAIRKKSGGKK